MYDVHSTSHLVSVLSSMYVCTMYIVRLPLPVLLDPPRSRSRAHVDVGVWLRCVRVSSCAVRALRGRVRASGAREQRAHNTHAHARTRTHAQPANFSFRFATGRPAATFWIGLPSLPAARARRACRASTRDEPARVAVGSSTCGRPGGTARSRPGWGTQVGAAVSYYPILIFDGVPSRGRWLLMRHQCNRI